MAVIAPTPIVLTNATIKIGTTNNYETSVSNVSLVPTTPSNTFKGVGGSVLVVAGIPTWKINLTYVQDGKTVNSLQSYLLANAGTTQPFVIIPAVGTGNSSYTISAVIVPGQIGGDVDALLTASVSMDAIGQPVVAML
jgi:hypothetical protein